MIVISPVLVLATAVAIFIILVGGAVTYHTVRQGRIPPVQAEVATSGLRARISAGTAEPPLAPPTSLAISAAQLPSALGDGRLALPAGGSEHPPPATG